MTTSVSSSKANQGANLRVRGLALSQDRFLAGTLVAIGGVAASLQFNDQLVGLTGDNAAYLLLGRALVSGQPYFNAEYPWGYPALLTPIMAIAGPDNIWVRFPG